MDTEKENAKQNSYKTEQYEKEYDTSKSVTKNS